jgi:hypothetical protein
VKKRGDEFTGAERTEFSNEGIFLPRESSL